MEEVELKTITKDRQPALIVDFSQVQSERPTRYVLGFYKGWTGSTKEFGGQEYNDGFEAGVAVREGRQEMPSWAFRPEDQFGDTIFEHIEDQSVS